LTNTLFKVRGMLAIRVGWTLREMTNLIQYDKHRYCCIHQKSFSINENWW